MKATVYQRLLCILLVVVMVAMLAPVGVLATEADNDASLQGTQPAEQAGSASQTETYTEPLESVGSLEPTDSTATSAPGETPTTPSTEAPTTETTVPEGTTAPSTDAPTTETTVPDVTTAPSTEATPSVTTVPTVTTETTQTNAPTIPGESSEPTEPPKKPDDGQEKDSNDTDPELDVDSSNQVDGQAEESPMIFAASPRAEYVRNKIIGQCYRPTNRPNFVWDTPANPGHVFDFMQFRRILLYGGEYPAYCIDPGKQFKDSYHYTEVINADASWQYYLSYTITPDQQKAIGLTLLYGYPNNLTPANTGQRVSYEVATQLIIWEIAIGIRSATHPYTCTNDGLRYSWDGTIKYGDYRAYDMNTAYRYIEEKLRTHAVVPSFADARESFAPTHNMTKNADGTYSITLEDENNILSQYTFTSEEGSGLTFSVDGNNLTITSSKEITAPITIAPTKNVPDLSKGAYLIAYDGGTNQTTLANAWHTPDDPVPAYFKLKAPAGTVAIQKTTDTGTDLGNWEMILKSGNEVIASGTTDSNGNLTWENIPIGTYTLYENVPSSSLYECENNNQTVTVTSGETTSVTVRNKLKLGQVTIQKRTNTGSDLGNWQFGIFSDAQCSNLLNTITTDANGFATSKLLQPGTVYVKEITTKTGWASDTSVKQATIKAGETVTLADPFVNTLLGNIQVTKTTNTGNNRGDWKVDLHDAYKRFVNTYTIPPSGVLTISGLVPGTYYVTEKGTSDPYWVCDTTQKAVTVNPGQTAAVSIENAHRGIAKVKKATNTGKDLDEWSFGLYSNEACTNLVLTLTTDSGGTDSAYVLPGTYWMKETGFANYSSEYWTYDSSVKKIVVSAGAETQIEFTNTHHGKIQIKKELTTDGPVADWEFQITRVSDNADMGTFKTGADGTFVTDKLLPGTYTVREIIPENSLFFCKTDNPVTVTVKEGETATVSFTNALRPGRIEIKKTDPSGNLLADAKFLLEWSEDGSTWTAVTYSDKEDVVKGNCSSANLQDGTLTTDGSGIIAFENLYPGIQYRVTELEAPNGFVLLSDYAFTGELPVENLEVKLEVVNSYGYTMPSTGSNGTDLPVIFGASLVAVALLMMGATFVGTKTAVSAYTRPIRANKGRKK